MSEQLSLPMPEQHRRAANHSRRPADFYAAVVWLRQRGYQVYAAGILHKVDRRLLSTDELKWFAEAEGWKP